MANDFGILLQTRLNTQNAQKAYETWKSSIQKKPINLDMTINSNSLKNLKTGLGSIQTQIDKLNPSVTFTNDQLRKMAQTVEGVNIPIKETSTSIDKWVTSNGHIITQTKKFDNELGSLITRVETYENTLGQTVTETKVFNDNMDLISKDLKTIDDRVAKADASQKKLALSEKEASNAAKEQAQSLNQVSTSTEIASRHTQTLAQRITTAAGKVALFKVSTTIVMAFYNAIGQAKDAVVEFDKAMVEFNKVTPLSNNEIEKMLTNFEKLSSEVGKTKTELVEIATEMSKSGFGTSTEEVTRMAELTALYQNTADEELSAADASKVLISQMRAFNYTADDAIHILDSINKVSAEFAVSSGDIGRGLTQAGAALQTYGNDYDQTVGLLTGASEIFIGRSQQVARGLNTIASRIAKNGETLEEYGVSIYDTNGQLRSTYEVLKDLKPVWDNLDASERVALGTTLAGY